MNQLPQEAEILLYSTNDGAVKIDVLAQDDTLWLTQKRMAELFGVQRPAITKHLKNIFETNELEENSVCSILEHTAPDGKNYQTQYYNLDAIIAVGYRVNSKQATQFRIWATNTLREFIIKGFITDIYAECSADYDPKSNITQTFYSTVQNKLHWAIHGHTAAEIVKTRANNQEPNMGLTTWKNAPQGKILKSDVSVAKNYLTKKELDELNHIVIMYLDYAELQAKKQRLMKMSDWVEKLDAFLRFNDYEVLDNLGKVSARVAKVVAETEYKKYRIEQDKQYRSDFDQLIEAGKNLK